MTGGGGRRRRGRWRGCWVGGQRRGHPFNDSGVSDDTLWYRVCAAFGLWWVAASAAGVFFAFVRPIPHVMRYYPRRSSSKLHPSNLIGLPFGRKTAGTLTDDGRRWVARPGPGRPGSIRIWAHTLAAAFLMMLCGPEHPPPRPLTFGPSGCAVRQNRWSGGTADA